jgi:hypothetical protein
MISLFIFLGLLKGHKVDHPAVLVKFYYVDRDYLTVGIDTLQSFGGGNVVRIIGRWDYDDFIPDVIVHVNT